MVPDFSTTMPEDNVEQISSKSPGKIISRMESYAHLTSNEIERVFRHANC